MEKCFRQLGEHYSRCSILPIRHSITNNLKRRPLSPLLRADRAPQQFCYYSIAGCHALQFADENALTHFTVLFCYGGNTVVAEWVLWFTGDTEQVISSIRARWVDRITCACFEAAESDWRMPGVDCTRAVVKQSWLHSSRISSVCAVVDYTSTTRVRRLTWQLSHHTHTQARRRIGINCPQVDSLLSNCFTCKFCNVKWLNCWALLINHIAVSTHNKFVLRVALCVFGVFSHGVLSCQYQCWVQVIAWKDSPQKRPIISLITYFTYQTHISKSKI